MRALLWRGRRFGARSALVWLVAVGAAAGWASAPLLTGAPKVVVAPSLRGIALVGQTLTASPGRWTGTGPIAYAYAWQRCSAQAGGCLPIEGAAGQGYQLSAEDAGASVRVLVTASNAAGSTSAPSGATAVVATSPPADALPLSGGGLSLPAADVVAPDRLLLESVSTRPAKPRAGQSVLVQVRVGDAAGYTIRGALVTVAALPYGLYQSAPAAATAANGLASLSLRPTRASLQAGLTPALLVRTDVPGATTPTAVSASSLLRLSLVAPASPKTTASPYLSGARGYDVSYPNCTRPRAQQAGFAVLGVNGGRPFTFNPCLAREYGLYAMVGPYGVYLNTGYKPTLRSRTTAACALAASAPGSSGQAYAIGCSEAATSLERITLLGLPAPAVWWLDVETSNSWSSTRALNIQVLRGMIDFLGKLTPTPVVGIYSRPSWWQAITAGWRVSNPEWSPGSAGLCPAPFSAGPVWLAQSGSATLDRDTAC